VLVVVGCEDGGPLGVLCVDVPRVLVPSSFVTVESLVEKRVVDVELMRADADDGAFPAETLISTSLRI